MALFKKREVKRGIEVEDHSLHLPAKRVVQFLEREHIATFTLQFEGELWSWHAFYRYLPQENLLITLSTPDSRHATLLAQMESPIVSGGISVKSRVVKKIRGVQFLAVAERGSQETFSRYRSKYLSRFPQAVLYPKGELWLFTLNYIKYSDNRFKFGEKYIWPL
ncbi:MAG: hypothetical protein WC960_00460 [Bacteroidales bacterium]